MKNKPSTLLKLSPLLLFATLIHWRIIYQADNSSIFDGLFLLILAAIFSLPLIARVYYDYVEYSLSNKLISFLPSLFAVLICLSFLATGPLLKIRDHSPALIIVSTEEHDLGFLSLEFREDGTYKITNRGFIGITIIRGDYTLYDSIIMLDRPNLNNYIVSDKLAIRYKNNSDGKRQKLLFQLDDSSKVIKGESYDLKIIWDKRRTNQ